MRFVSEQFKEIQDEIIRPALSRLTLEVGTEIVNSVVAKGGSINPLGFDTTVAPVVAPKVCRNKRYYAVLGDNTAVDDPYRICAPDNSGSIATPNHSVPYGITPYMSAYQKNVVGNVLPDLNFTGLEYPITLRFLGGHKPTRIDFEYYDAANDAWNTEVAHEDLNGFTTVTFYPSGYVKDRIYRFSIQAPTPGRFQLADIMGRKSYLDGNYAVTFGRNYVEKASVSMETDLTSQSLPSYEMTVTCLDVDGIYSPESSYWQNQFSEGSPAYLTLAYEVNGVNEFVDIMLGKLTEKPNYEQGKITFKIAIDWRTEWTYNFMPHLNDALNVGDSVDGNSFYQIIFNGKLFDNYPVESAECNYGGELDTRDTRQLIANALGCYIKAEMNTVSLLNANEIPYRDYDDYLTRYEQIKCSLESRAKVGRISVKRYDNTVASDYVDIECPNRAEIGSDNHRYGIFSFELPFFAMGKYEIVDAQSTNPDAVISLYNNAEVYKLDNGNYEADLPLIATEITSIKPIIRFYKTDTADYEETETLGDSVSGEVYTNDNQLVTNRITANKVKQAAHLVSDISYQYEVDNMQDFRYEVGDIIRLETEKNVYKTCVITGIRFELPGSTGHITCRKIFSFEDSDEAILEPVGLIVAFGTTDIEVTKASERACFVGVLHTPATSYIYVMGVEEFDMTVGGTTTQETYNGELTDLNNHSWKFAYYSVPSGTQIITGARIVDLPQYEVSSGISEGAFGAISLLKEIYKEQGMNAPVDYTCNWTTY